jgi:predicted transcriptional regulator
MLCSACPRPEVPPRKRRVPSSTETLPSVSSRPRSRGRPTVEQLMSRQIISCSPKDDIGLAQELMVANHKSRIVCVNDAGRLVGVISLPDIAQHEDGARAAETPRQVAEREIRA